MTQAAHTPGPWKISKCRCGHPSCNQYTISVQGSVGFDEPDARLIAASPELLEALEDATAIIEEEIRGYSGSLCAFRAAIAKARGQA